MTRSPSKLTIALDPVPASRPRVTRWGTYYLKKYADWLKAAHGSLPVPSSPFLGPVSVDLHVICRCPAKPANPYPVGDVDNYAKAALDALTATKQWGDDKQVVILTVRKRYALPGEKPATHVLIQETTT